MEKQLPQDVLVQDALVEDQKDFPRAVAALEESQPEQHLELKRGLDDEYREHHRDRCQELRRRIELGELEPQRYDPNEIYYSSQADEPLRQKHLGRKAVVLSLEDFQELGGYIEYVSREGMLVQVDIDHLGFFGPDDRYVLFPEELGQEVNEELDPLT